MSGEALVELDFSPWGSESLSFSKLSIDRLRYCAKVLSISLPNVLVLFHVILSNFSLGFLAYLDKEAACDHLDRERSKRQPISKEELCIVLQEAWRADPENDRKV